jgi:hypothetical protein
VSVPASAMTGDPDADAFLSGAAPPTAAAATVDTGDPDANAAISTFRTPAQQKQEDAAKKPSLLDRYIGFQESQIHGATGGVASLAGGLSYVGDRVLLGKSDEEAQADKDRVEQFYTYQPRSAEGQRQAAAMDSAAQSVGADVGHYVGGKLAAGAQAVGASPEVVGAAGATGEVIGNLPQFVVGDVGLDALGRGRVAVQSRMADAAAAKVAPKAQAAVDSAYAAQSQGAAVVPPDVTTLRPEIQQGIADQTASGATVNPEALERIKRADQFGINLTEGQASRDAGIYSNEKNSTDPKLATNEDVQDTKLVGALDGIRQETSPSTVQNNARQHGQALLNQYKIYDEPIKADISAKYQALEDANGGTIPIDPQQAVANAQQSMRRANVDTFLPDKVRAMVQNAADGGEFTANTLENLRTRLATAARSATDGNEAHAINLTRDAFEQLPMKGPEAIKFKGLADAARGAARARFDEIAADPAYEAAVNDYKGNTFVKPGQTSQLADSFMNDHVLNAPRADLETMQAKFKNNPEAQEAIAGHALNTLKEAAGINADNKGFKQHGYNKALKKMSDKTDLIFDPQTSQKLTDLGAVASDIQVPPPGHSVNYSKSGVIGIAAMKGLDAAEHLANKATFGMGGTLARSFLPAGEDIAARALRPAAGVTYKRP